MSEIGISLQQELQMIYPTFEPTADGILLPRILLPLDLQKKVPKFYEQGRKQTIETYQTEDIGKLKNWDCFNLDTRLVWHDELGLKHIKVGLQGSLDLEIEGWPHFREHNLGLYTGIIAGMITTKYVSELAKSAS